MNGPLRRCERDALGALPGNALAWLRTLAAPVAIRAPGRDRTRARVVVTLLHGNEPSGLRAIHAWLRGGAEPAVDAWLVIANPDAALAEPALTHRSAPGRRDLNRCFLGPFDGPDGALARAILDRLADARPEAVVDLHNNSGQNPPYGVAVDTGRATRHLVALFADRLVHSRLELGALLEALGEVPCATIEVGRGGDAAADAVALAGLTRFLERDAVLESSGDPLLQVLEMPMRAELAPGVRLAVADAPDEGAHLTLRADLDRHNFERVEAGTAIGWCAATPRPLVLRDEDGADRSADYFRWADGELRTARPLVPIMITTDPAIAASDCLFYVVREID